MERGLVGTAASRTTACPIRTMPTRLGLDEDNEAIPTDLGAAKAALDRIVIPQDTLRSHRGDDLAAVFADHFGRAVELVRRARARDLWCS